MRLFVKQTRAITYIPCGLWFFLLLGLFSQCFWHYSFSTFLAKRDVLSLPPAAHSVRLLSYDDPVPAAKLLMLWLQAFDNQPGISIPLLELDYNRVIKWLDLVLTLDNKTHYPLLAAIRFYAEVQDKAKQKKMIDFVTRKFLQAPNARWQFMAHAVYVAKYRAKDMSLALECAKMLRLHAKGENVPYWAKQMEIFVLENMGELESAMVLIGGLLESGELTEPNQRAFLKQRLEEIKQRQTEPISSH